MADKNIGLLPQASTLTDDSSFVCEDSGIAKRVTGKQFKDFAKEGALPAVKAAESAADRAEVALTKAPKIQNGTWWVFDASSQAYVDTGVKAQGERGIQGERGETGAPGQPGEKGDPFRYEDFTPEQLDDLERGAKAAQAAAETAAASAATSARQASVSEQNAVGSASAAKASEDAAKASETAASGSSSSAQESAASASASASEASASATAAAESETSAIEAKTAAETAKTEAGKSASAAKASEDAAKESENASAESASAASASAGAAKVSETAAKASESAAEESASQAAGSASYASGSAEGAANSANAASESESAAEAAKNAAQASETAAKASETAAKASETAAKSSETASKQSETAASVSASAAQQSASAAAESATAAAQSAGSIGDAEQVVTQKAEEASASAESAAASAEAAARSAEQAEEVVGGNFATKSEAQGYANTAESNAKAYADQQIAAIPTPDVPTKVSELENDSGYLTSYTETDPTVPAWAKAKTKPTYTASEVGALPDTTSIPTALSDLSDDAAHRVVTDEEKNAWSAKQDAITGHQGQVVGFGEDGKPVAQDAPKAEIFSVSLPTSGWSNNAQPVSHAMLKAAGYGYIYNPDEASYGAYVSALVRCGDVVTDGQVTFYCDETPTDDITVDFIRIEANENV